MQFRTFYVRYPSIGPHAQCVELQELTQLYRICLTKQGYGLCRYCK